MNKMTRVNGRTKALTIAKIAKDNGWKGQIDWDDDAQETTLKAKRNDESFIMVWQDKLLENDLWDSRLILCKYKILQRVYTLSQLDTLKRIMGWPDIIKVLKINGGRKDPVELIETYRRLPFNWRTDDNDSILNSLCGRQVWWYNRMDTGVYHVGVKPPKKKTSLFEIRNIEDRKLFNFIDSEVGMRSILLDTILKVE